MHRPHRSSLDSSLPNPHPDIKTPSWRQYVPNCDTTNHHFGQLSDDDTTPEAYINTFHKFALEERTRWAGTAVTNPSTPNTTPRVRAKLSAKRIIPVFPTPTEAFHLVRSSLKHFQENNCVAPTSSPQNLLSEQYHLLETLETTITCLAELEEKLSSARTSIKAAVNAHAYHQGETTDCARHLGKRTLPELNILYPFSLNSLVHHQPSDPICPNLYQSNGSIGPSASRPFSQPSTPPLPSKASSLLTKDSIAMINKHAYSKALLIEQSFSMEFSSMKEKVKNLARQAQISVSESASFQAIATAITRALRSHRGAKREENGLSSDGNQGDSKTLESIIRGKIDAEKYPLLARSFQLDAEYCLDGTRRPIRITARGKINGSEPDQSDRKPWDGLHLLEPHVPDEGPRTREPIEITSPGNSSDPEPAQSDRKRWNGLHLLESHESEERAQNQGNVWTSEHTNGSGLRQGRSGSVDRNGFGTELGETKKGRSCENENELLLSPPRFQTSRLDARRKLRQNVKRKLPRIHKERRSRKGFRFRDSAESISSGSSGASSSSRRWNSFREDGTEAMAIGRRPSVTVQFEQVVDLDEKEEGTEPSVVYLDDEG